MDQPLIIQHSIHPLTITQIALLQSNCLQHIFGTLAQEFGNFPATWPRTDRRSSVCGWLHHFFVPVAQQKYSFSKSLCLKTVWFWKIRIPHMWKLTHNFEKRNVRNSKMMKYQLMTLNFTEVHRLTSTYQQKSKSKILLRLSTDPSKMAFLVRIQWSWTADPDPVKFAVKGVQGAQVLLTIYLRDVWYDKNLMGSTKKMKNLNIIYRISYHISIGSAKFLNHFAYPKVFLRQKNASCFFWQASVAWYNPLWINVWNADPTWSVGCGFNFNPLFQNK